MCLHYHKYHHHHAECDYHVCCTQGVHKKTGSSGVFPATFVKFQEELELERQRSRSVRGRVSHHNQPFDYEICSQPFCDVEIGL